MYIINKQKEKFVKYHRILQIQDWTSQTQAQTLGQSL